MRGRHNVVYRIAVSLAATLITVWWTAHARAQEFRADLLVDDTVQVTRMEDALRTVLTGDKREQARFASVAIEMMADFIARS